jgi:hypothetical protein
MVTCIGWKMKRAGLPLAAPRRPEWQQAAKRFSVQQGTLNTVHLQP